MGAFLLGSALMLGGVFASFVPPFIWGVPLFAIGFFMMWKGIFTTTYSAAKTTVAIGRELSRGSTQNYTPPTYDNEPSYSPAPSRFVDSPSFSENSAPSSSITPSGNPAKAYDVEKWEALRKYDPVVKPIYESLLPYGQAAVDEFAKAYIAMNRPDLANSMAAQIIEDIKTATNLQKQKLENELRDKDEKTREVIKQTIESAKRLMQKIEMDGMTYNGRKVIKTELYYGKETWCHGMALIKYADGHIEARTETSHGVLFSED